MLNTRTLAGTAPRLYAAAQDARLRLQIATWHSRNWRRVASHRLSGQPVRSENSAALDRDGIAITSFEDVFAEDDLFYHAQSLALELQQASTDALSQSLGSRGRVEIVSAGEAFLAIAGRSDDFKIQMIPRGISLTHPFAQMALNSRLLALVNHYMGLSSYCRAIELWWDRPTEGPPMQTQLWHNDADDTINIKVFVHFNEVDGQTGPFCFIPGSQPRGARRFTLIRGLVQEGLSGRLSDEQMGRFIPAAEWRVCIGQPGTVILCDTCGFHKGLKPETRGRLMLMLQYTSPMSPYPREFQFLTGSARLTPAQRAAAA